MATQPQSKDDQPESALAAERNTTLARIADLVAPLNQSLIGPSEVVLHDLSKLPNSIVAIAGRLTGRSVGGPATDAVLEAWYAGTLRTSIGYETTLPDGRPMRSTTIVLFDEAGPYGALCLNVDVSIWHQISEMASAILHGGTWPGLSSVEEAPHEEFAQDINELASRLLSRAVSAIGVPVDLMRKEHKLRVVADLRSRGFFLLKDAVEQAASTLQVTRFTVYNYLNELDAAEEDGEPDDAPTDPA